MSPIQALQVLDQVRQNASMNGKDHDVARQAITVLNEFVSKHSKPEPVEDEKGGDETPETKPPKK